MPGYYSSPAASYSPVPYRSDAPGAFKTIRTGAIGAGQIDYGANRLRKVAGGVRISKDSISAPSNFQSVGVLFLPSRFHVESYSYFLVFVRRHILHASDADQAEELLMRWSAEGVGKVPSEFVNELSSRFVAFLLLKADSKTLHASPQTLNGQQPSREPSKHERNIVKPSLSLKFKQRCIETGSSSLPPLLRPLPPFFFFSFSLSFSPPSFNSLAAYNQPLHITNGVPSSLYASTIAPTNTVTSNNSNAPPSSSFFSNVGTIGHDSLNTLRSTQQQPPSPLRDSNQPPSFPRSQTANTVVVRPLPMVPGLPSTGEGIVSGGESRTAPNTPMQQQQAPVLPPRPVVPTVSLLGGRVERVERGRSSR